MDVGTPLKAARAGAVKRVAFGLLAIRVGAETDWYVHIDRAAPGIAAGVQVQKGQLVAFSGAKVPAGGSLTGSHLHFERQSGALNHPATSIDPVPTLSGLPGGITGAEASEEDMFTNTDRAVLNIIHAALTGNDPVVNPVPIQDVLATASGGVASIGRTLGTMADDVAAIKAQLAGLHARSALSPAQEQQLTGILAIVTRLEESLKTHKPPDDPGR
jgi:hypothetical protein